jgi:hypothetical protein
MKNLSYRITDDPKIWAKIPRKADDAFDYLYRHLIEENEALMSLAEKKDCAPFEGPVRKKVSRAQEVLLLIYRLDSQILNGGVTQFVWNSPFELDDVQKAAKRLGQIELLKLRKKLEVHLNDNEIEWTDLWNKGHTTQGMVKECFISFRALLGLKWFDKDYLKKHRAKLIDALVKFVIKNKKEFVR